MAGATTPNDRPLVFLCHSSGDKERVRELYRRLTSDGVRCWLDEEDLIPGQDWQLEIERALARSSYVIACLSTSSITKAGYVQKELKRALDLADERPEGSIFLIPVRLEPCEIPDRLSRIQYVDLFADYGYGRLVKSLGVKELTAQSTTDHPLLATGIMLVGVESNREIAYRIRDALLVRLGIRVSLVFIDGNDYPEIPKVPDSVGTIVPIIEVSYDGKAVVDERYLRRMRRLIIEQRNLGRTFVGVKYGEVYPEIATLMTTVVELLIPEPVAYFRKTAREREFKEGIANLIGLLEERAL